MCDLSLRLDSDRQTGNQTLIVTLRLIVTGRRTTPGFNWCSGLQHTGSVQNEREDRCLDRHTDCYTTTTAKGRGRGTWVGGGSVRGGGNNFPYTQTAEQRVGAHK